jgi:methyl-accepting chemotaxis protein
MKRPATGLMSRLSLAAKLYSIFALFALLTAAITALSDFNTRRSTELTEAVQTASRAALNVEHVNSLVYAIVMESRGVYMSTEAVGVKKYGDGLLKFNDQLVVVVQGWESIVQADDAGQFALFKKRIEQFMAFRKELVRRAVEVSPAAGREWGDNDANREVRIALNKDLDALTKVYAERGKRIALQTESNRQLAFLLTCLGGLELVLVGAGVLIIFRSVARPLSVITATIKQVAEGADNVEVPHTDRTDEIGALARAIQIFKQAMDRNRNLNSQVLLDSKAREERARHIENSVEAFRGAIGSVLGAVNDNASAMRDTARPSPRWHRMRVAVRRLPRVRPSRPPPTCSPSPAPPNSCRHPSRRSAGRCVIPPRSSSKPACGLKNRSPKLKVFPPRPSVSTACSA